jgi:hypothetical protein
MNTRRADVQHLNHDGEIAKTRKTVTHSTVTQLRMRGLDIPTIVRDLRKL